MPGVSIVIEVHSDLLNDLQIELSENKQSMIKLIHTYKICIRSRLC